MIFLSFFCFVAKIESKTSMVTCSCHIPTQCILKAIKVVEISPEKCKGSISNKSNFKQFVEKIKYRHVYTNNNKLLYCKNLPHYFKIGVTGVDYQEQRQVVFKR